MKNLIQLMMIACLVLPFAACKKQEAPKQAAAAPLTAPASPDDRNAWNAYLTDVVSRNMEGVQNQPFVYTLPPESNPDFQGLYERQLDKAKSDVGRGIISGNLLAYGGPSSAKMADLVVESFKAVPAGT